MEAHGLALQGDTKACIAALQEAEDQFCRVRIQNIPLWLRYFDQAYLSAKFGHTLRDLGQPVNAERFARQSLRMTNGYERGRAFNTALIAGVLADKGDLDESVAYAQQALHLFDNIRSTRAVSYMTDVAYRLNRFNQDIRVQSLYKNMACRRIPLSPAS